MLHCKTGWRPQRGLAVINLRPPVFEDEQRSQKSHIYATSYLHISQTSNLWRRSCKWGTSRRAQAQPGKIFLRQLKVEFRAPTDHTVTSSAWQPESEKGCTVFLMLWMETNWRLNMTVTWWRSKSRSSLQVLLPWISRTALNIYTSSRKASSQTLTLSKTAEDLKCTSVSRTNVNVCLQKFRAWREE